jgi:hypothetical protein
MYIIYKQDPQTKSLNLVYRFNWLNAIEMVKQQCITFQFYTNKFLKRCITFQYYTNKLEKKAPKITCEDYITYLLFKGLVFQFLKVFL